MVPRNPQIVIMERVEEEGTKKAKGEESKQIESENDSTSVVMEQGSEQNEETKEAEVEEETKEEEEETKEDSVVDLMKSLDDTNMRRYEQYKRSHFDRMIIKRVHQNKILLFLS